MHEYIHTKIHTYKHLKIHSFTLVHTHYILYIFIHILIAHTYDTYYIHCDSLSAASSIASSSARFSPSCFFTFYFLLFHDWASTVSRAAEFILKIIFSILNIPIEVRFTVSTSFFITDEAFNIMGHSHN